MYCTNCGEALNNNQAVCLKCGVKVGEGYSFCQECGAATNQNAEVCLSCGVALKNRGKTGDLNGQDKTTMIIVCLFLGGLGVHNFMMGETKKGIFKIVMLLCCGLGEIFALIDLIKIAMGTYVVDPTKLI